MRLGMIQLEWRWLVFQTEVPLRNGIGTDGRWQGKTGLSKAMIVAGTQTADCLWRHVSICQASDGAALKAT